jgi:hypothetical protein
MSDRRPLVKPDLPKHDVGQTRPGGPTGPGAPLPSRPCGVGAPDKVSYGAGWTILGGRFASIEAVWSTNHYLAPMPTKSRFSAVRKKRKPGVRPTARAALPPRYLRPRWDGWTRTLTFNGQVVKRFGRVAPNVELVLAAFERRKWAQRINNPLPAVRGRDRKRHLHETIQNINRRLDHRLLFFRGDGTGRGIVWGPD